MSKKLTFETARDKLSKISKGDYRSITYELTEGKQVPDVTCKLYLNNYGYHEGETWEEAFKSLRKTMHPSKKVSLDQAPK